MSKEEAIALTEGIIIEDYTYQNSIVFQFKNLSWKNGLCYLKEIPGSVICKGIRNPTDVHRMGFCRVLVDIEKIKQYENEWTI